MKIIVGADHRGIQLRDDLAERLEQLGHQVQVCGAQNSKPIDYPEVAAMVGRRVSRGDADLGILLSGTGLGMCVTANKFYGVRAVQCYDEFMVERSRRHLDANVICLPADLLAARLAIELVETWVNTPFEGGRHGRRVEQIAALERPLHTTLQSGGKAMASGPEESAG